MFSNQIGAQVPMDTLSTCSRSELDESLRLRCKRDLFDDMKKGIDCLKEFKNKLDELHPEVFYKIRTLF